MTTRLDQRGWAAAQDLAPCVLCHQPAIMRSPRGKPCHWTSAITWASEHQGDEQGRENDQACCTLASPCRQASCGACYPEQYQDQGDEHTEAEYGNCPACKGGGLVPPPGCTCDGNTHTCIPATCSMCSGTGRA